MNLNDYISSGILEAYVLGELSSQERADVEKRLQENPALREELARIEEVQEQMLQRLAIQPRVSVKESVLEKIGQPAQPHREGRQVSFWRFAAAAAITLAIISTYFAFNYRTLWKRSESDLGTLIAQNERMAHNYNQVNERLDKMEENLKVMDNPGFQKVIMTGTPNAPDAMASVYWNRNTNEVYLSLQNIKALAREQQYQLWAIIDGKPVDAGVFDGNVAGLHKMKSVDGTPVLFAVTIEPRGGKSSPTLHTMQVKGEVGKS